MDETLEETKRFIESNLKKDFQDELGIVARTKSITDALDYFVRATEMVLLQNSIPENIDPEKSIHPATLNSPRVIFLKNLTNLIKVIDDEDFFTPQENIVLISKIYDTIESFIENVIQKMNKVRPELFLLKKNGGNIIQQERMQAILVEQARTLGNLLYEIDMKEVEMLDDQGNQVLKTKGTEKGTPKYSKIRTTKGTTLTTPREYAGVSSRLTEATDIFEKA